MKVLVLSNIQVEREQYQKHLDTIIDNKLYFKQHKLIKVYLWLENLDTVYHKNL